MVRTPPFKADVVGSLLRPQEIHQARAQVEQGTLSRDALWGIESRCVEAAVAMQKSVGLKVCTDGEFHRRHWFLDFLEKIDGVEVHGGLPMKFHNDNGEVEFAPPRSGGAGFQGAQAGGGAPRACAQAADPLAHVRAFSRWPRRH